MLAESPAAQKPERTDHHSFGTQFRSFWRTCDAGQTEPDAFAFGGRHTQRPRFGPRGCRFRRSAFPRRASRCPSPRHI